MTGTATTPSHDLQAGPLRLALRPDLGGCIAGFWHRQTPILRSTEPAALAAARKSACYPLLPYSNRLAYRRFRWLGQDYTTQPNFDDSPHSVHGVGWIRPWQVVAGDAARLVMQYVHPGDADWPFPFEATQSFDLTPDALGVQLAITNTWDSPQPVGLGWHPYFEARHQSRLKIDVRSRWDADAAELPVREVAQSGIDGKVDDLDYDNCFEGFSGAALIDDERFTLHLSASLDRLVVFTPHDRPYYCVEPVSHLSNAIARDDPAAHGLRTLAPGERFDAAFKLRVEVQ